MDKCYLCSAYLPKSEGNRMECPRSGSFSISLASIFYRGYLAITYQSKPTPYKLYAIIVLLAIKGTLALFLLLGQ